MGLAIVFSLLAVNLLAANADNAEIIQSGMILGGANTEFGVGSHVFYVMYPGIKNAQLGKARFEIMKTDLDLTEFTSLHNYTVEQGEEEKPYTHFFGLRENTPETEWYTIRFCDGESRCSKPSSPPTVIDHGQKKLDCKEKLETVKDIDIPSVLSYATEQELGAYKNAMPNSIAAQEGITSNPMYKKSTERGEFMYFLIKYPLHGFKPLFEVEGDTEGYCKRKYTFMVITLVVDKKTKKILKRGRFTPAPLPEDKIDTYITGESPKDIPIEFKLNIKSEDAQKPNLEIWQTVCMSAKDMVSSRKDGFSARCSEPFTQDWDTSLVENDATIE